MGQVTPLNAGAIDIENGIHDIGDAHLSGTACLRLRKEVRQQFPLGICHIAGVGLPHD